MTKQELRAEIRALQTRRLWLADQWDADAMLDAIEEQLYRLRTDLEAAA